MNSCFFCGAVDLHGTADYKMLASKVPSSHKSIGVVLTHLASCMKMQLDLKDDTQFCPKCFKDLADYDTIMVNLMVSQKRLTKQLKAALTNDFVDDMLVEYTNKTAQEATDGDGDAEAEALFVELVKEEEEEDGEAAEDDNSMEIKEEFEDEYDDDDDVDEDEEFICEDKSDEAVKLEDFASKQGKFQNIPKRMKQECSTCSKAFNSRYQLQKHITEEHCKTQTHVCPICGIIRRDEEYLELHMNVHEGKTEKQCRYCPKSFSRPVNTLRHMRMHWDKKKYQCEKCGLRFSQDNLLYNHRLRHEAEENPIICSICNVSFKSRKTFNHHTLIHKENRPRHYCSVCPKSFTERYTLKMHMKTHDGDVVYGVREDVPTDDQVVEELQVDVDESEQAVTVIMSDNDDNSSALCLICSTNFENKKELEHHLQFDHDVVLK
ncbi:LOW QUALITY PROTEIN: serendipity locus protein delta [Drosophila sulfurigaster albostrigata]|uniref:LOW QUALITY PROTEIN: serendipity locus protein delta n=1 Tax=Drosophila sulfurigaster albostrigata TaxID=89887 RepID=UPI002D21B970|nr:LOW QUALITY PROTEIN: serendipity locus protein delta [Drosophila sulfurigaster albostrigata]